MSDKPNVVAWHTEDHLTDKSATTYIREVADRWLDKGWPVKSMIMLSDHEASRIDDKARIEDLENLLKAHYSKQFFIHRDDI